MADGRVLAEPTQMRPATSCPPTITTATARLHPDNTISLVVGCPDGCTGTLTLRAGSQTLATVPFGVYGPTLISVPVRRRARHFLRAHGRTRATATLRTTAGTIRRTLTLTT
jgi:hypothetical protein